MMSRMVALGVAAAAEFCALAFAFQGPAGPIQVRTHSPLATVEPSDETASQPILRVNSSLVLVPVRVTDADGVTVTSLHKDDFEIFEDGVRQPITHFAKDDAPVSVGVLLDISGSMKNKMERASQAATEFFKYANPEDEFFLVEFNERAKLKTSFTRDWPGITDQISRARASGETAMLDAIHLALSKMKGARFERKALLVISDGGDNISRRSFRELKNTLLEADVQVYSLGVYDSDYALKKHTPEERNGPTLLDRVAKDTGGRDFPVGLDNLPTIGTEIARELRNQYVLGFAPATATADGKFHRVNLKLAASHSPLRAYYRQGYYAPNQ